MLFEFSDVYGISRGEDIEGRRVLDLLGELSGGSKTEDWSGPVLRSQIGPRVRKASVRFAAAAITISGCGVAFTPGASKARQSANCPV